ncbi:MAG: nickel pincer cofactor biosynthesis protein LarC [Deltaproteobacteria bacterium]|nr:nickel pincer cofactor biosynthesis protein LarC [Deltaproteobacteria bacterium]
MRLLYFDCPMGISGDMCLGALVDLGVDPKALVRELKKLPIEKDKIDVAITKETRHSITGTAFRVRLPHERHHRTFKDISGIIDRSALAPDVKALGLAIFKTIAVAEAKVHGIAVDAVHFHEVGALDSIIDIVGAAYAITSLKIDRCVSSPVALGSGWADTMHGRIPIPAPATLEILKGAPSAPPPAPFELTTPTGAAILATVVNDYGPMPAMTIEAIGYGAGKKDFREAANLLRVVVGECAEALKSGLDDRVSVIETNIDDMTPQTAGYLMDRLLNAGALDVFYTPVQMKKGRPAVLLTVLADESRKDELIGVIFDESTSIGIRISEVERRCLERKVIKVKTRYGAVRVKVSMRAGRAVNAQPEYDDCREIAEKKKVPLKKVMDAARAALAGDTDISH